MSQRAMRLELKRKGISDEVVMKVLDESAYSEDAALRELITKKQRIARYQDPQTETAEIKDK